MKGLRPGEVKILVSLQKGEKSFTELHKKTGLQSNVLSEYLKRLQKDKLVARDIDTRRYRMKKVSSEVLFYNEILGFLESRLEIVVNKGKKQAGVKTFGLHGWLIFTESVAVINYLENSLDDQEIHNALEKLSRVVEDSWDSHILSEFGEKDRKTIETYRRFLLEYAKEHLARPANLDRKNQYRALFELEKARMASEYPGIPVPKEMIQVAAAKRLKQILRRHDEILRPENVERLHTFLGMMRRLGQVREDLPEDQVKKLENVLAYLEDPQNKKIYKGYTERVNNSPKSMLLYPSWGFKGYFRKLSELLLDSLPHSNRL